jgi:flavin reductase (DIM6/NTAB) family NADH-FMN oxidoreductase RutF
MEFDFTVLEPECRVERLIDYPRCLLVLGEVVNMHVRRDCLDAESRYVNPDVHRPIARLHANNCITSDRRLVPKAPPITDFANLPVNQQR